MSSELLNGAEAKDIGSDFNQIVFGDALSALSYNDWLKERAFKEASLVPIREYWDKICPCEIHYDDTPMATQKSLINCNTNLAPQMVPPISKPIATAAANFATA